MVQQSMESFPVPSLWEGFGGLGPPNLKYETL